MHKLSQFHPSKLAPWEPEQPQSDSQQFSNTYRHRIYSPRRRQVMSCTQSKRPSQSSSRMQKQRTAVKMTTINISADKASYPKAPKDPFATYTPKNIQIGIFQKSSKRRESPELSPFSHKKNTIMTIDTWREESKRILSKMSKRRAQDCRYSNKSVLNKGIEQRKGGEKDNLQVLAKFLEESSLGDSLLVYKKPKTEHPNVARFKMLQLQKKIKF